MKIGICGAPGSGKTTLAAMLYAEFLKAGIGTTRLVLEKAPELIGRGEDIANLAGQTKLLILQRKAECDAFNSGYDPVICDGPVWMGAIYQQQRGMSEFDRLQYVFEESFMEDVAKYMARVHHFCDYTHLVYVPLNNSKDQNNVHRIHDAKQSRQIAYMIEERFRNEEAAKFFCPIEIDQREKFIKELVTSLIPQIG